MSDLLPHLKARGQFFQCTDESNLSAHLSSADASIGGRRLYNGFDPTADSLTIGNLVPIMLLRRFQRAGHTPFVLLGGATGLIGDPSGKEAERALRTEDEVRANIDGQRKIFESLLDFDPKRPNPARLCNNYDWFKSIGFIEALRDIGKHFSVNEMIKRDSVRNRLEGRDHGISFTEFAYMLLQAYDFLHLFRAESVTIQSAGADQWGNIVSGVDLVRRAEGLDDHGNARAIGLTAPLLTKADGSKFGKTESGAIWLSHKRPSGEPGSSPYAYYQFWLNAADADLRNFLLIFTDISDGEVVDLCARHEAEPHKREAQRTLAQHATTLLHGKDAMQHAEHAAQALFSGDVASMDLDALTEVFAEAPHTDHARASLSGDGAPLTDVLAQTSLASSKGEARKHLAAGAISINGRKITIADAHITAADLLHDHVALLRRGKKTWHVTRWS